MTRLEELAAVGQSVWLDNINRKLFTTGKLKELIQAGLLGMTSNPSIFDNAISKSDDYDSDIRSLAPGKDSFGIYDELTIKDIQEAADLFRPVYERTGGFDGYVSLEINPRLARKSKETLEEGKRLHKKVNRPNLMLKVPATDEGFSPVEELLAEGINVNITLIFSREQYERTALAYMKGIKRLADRGGDPGRVHSVASVFVSRIDTAVDAMLNEKLASEECKALHGKLREHLGKAAVANSLAIYRSHQSLFSSPEFKGLRDRGANYQRVLWASTSSKNPAYSDIKYVEELIMKNTVNTMPEVTLGAFMDHGAAKEIQGGENPDEVIAGLKDLGINLDDVNGTLLADGVIAFEMSFESLMTGMEAKARKLHV